MNPNPKKNVHRSPQLREPLCTENIRHLTGYDVLDRGLTRSETPFPQKLGMSEMYTSPFGSLFPVCRMCHGCEEPHHGLQGSSPVGSRPKTSRIQRGAHSFYRKLSQKLRRVGNDVPCSEHVKVLKLKFENDHKDDPATYDPSTDGQRFPIAERLRTGTLGSRQVLMRNTITQPGLQSVHGFLF